MKPWQSRDNDLKKKGHLKELLKTWYQAARKDSFQLFQNCSYIEMKIRRRFQEKGRRPLNIQLDGSAQFEN